MFAPRRISRWWMGIVAVVAWGAPGLGAAPVELVPPPAREHQFSALAISPDGKLIVALERRGLTAVWDEHHLKMTAMVGWGGLAFSGDGKRLAMGRTTGSVALYEGFPVGDNLVLLGQHTGAVNCVAYAAKASRIASGGDDNQVRLWDPDAGRVLHVLEGHEGLVCAVALAADGKRIASASLDLTVRVWDAESGKELRRLEGHRDQVHGLAFTPDGKHLFSAGRDGLVCCWDVGTGKEVRRFDGHRGAVRGLSLSDDGKTLATCGEDGSLRLWDAATGREFRRIDVCPDGVSAVAFFPGGASVATADPSGAVLQWDIRSGAKRRELRLDGGKSASASRMWCLAWSRDGRYLASGGSDHWVRLWDARTGKQVRALGRHEDVVWSVAFSPDGKHVASAGRRDGLVHLWDVSTGEPVYRFGRAHKGGISRIAWSADGKQLVSAGGSFDPALHLWDAMSGKLLRRLEGHQNLVDGLGLSADGRWAASAAAGDGVLRLWDLTTGRSRELGATPTWRIALAPGGEWVATAGDGGLDLTLWDLDGAGGTRRIEGHEFPTSAVAVSENGYMLAAGDQGSNVYLWECSTGQLRGKFSTAAGSVGFLAFRPDGKALALTASPGGPGGWRTPEGHARIYDLEDLARPTRGTGPAEAFGLLAERDRLRGDDAARAWAAMRRLVAAKDRAVRVLGPQLRFAAAVPVAEIDRWVRQLDSDTFAIRERATRRLREIGRPARPALKRALADSPSPEARRRLEDLLEQTPFAISPEERQTWRALEVFEEIGTPAARAVLERVSAGAEGDISRSARAALDRLRRLSR
jgi:WD40 repeat protein